MSIELPFEDDGEFGDKEFGVSRNDMEHSFGIEENEAKAIKNLFQYGKPPELRENTDYAKLFIWLETLAEKKGYAISQGKQTPEAPGEIALWMLAVSVPDREGLEEYFKLLDQYRTNNLQRTNLTEKETNLVTSMINVDMGSYDDDTSVVSGGEVIVRDGRLVIPNDTLHNIIEPLKPPTMELGVEAPLMQRATIPQSFKELYNQLIQRLTTDGIPLEEMNVYSQLLISHSVDDKEVKTFLTKKLCLRYEKVVEGTDQKDLKYIKLRVDIDVNKPELLKLAQLKLGMSSGEVKDVIDDYIPLPEK